MHRIRRLALITTIATLLLISVGGFVRAAGAGLGCESWPKCFPWSWLPPISIDQLPDHVDPETFSFTKAWIEYVNRMIGVVIGLLIVATWWVVWRDGRDRRDLLLPASAAVPLVAFQGWLGGQVVKYELDPRFVTVHLVLALGLVAMLVYIAVAAHRGSRDAPVRVLGPTVPSRRPLARLTSALLVVASAQIVLGALVRGSIDLAAKAATGEEAGGTPDERMAWLGDVGWIDWTHRKVALVVLVLVAWSLWVARSRSLPDGVRRAARWNAALVLGQVLAGVALAYLGLPPAAQVIHITLGAWLLCGLFLQHLLLRAPDPTPA